MSLALATPPDYEVVRDKKEVVTNLRAEAKHSDEIWLATDPDREGVCGMRELGKRMSCDRKR